MLRDKFDAIILPDQSPTEILEGFTAPNIRYQPLNATRFVPPLEFVDNDLMHMTHADPMGPHLGSELCKLVHKVKDRAVCFERKVKNSG